MQYSGTKRKTMVLLLLLLLVALGSAALAWLEHADRKAEDAASQAAEGTIPLLEASAETLEQIRIETPAQTLTLDYTGGSWTLEEDPAYHLDESSCNTMLTALSALNAKRQLTQEPGEDYGFAEPQATVTVTTKDGSNTFVLGAQNPITGDVYLQKAGESAIYTVAAAKLNCFLTDKASLFGAFNPAGLTSSALEAVSYTLADGETVSLKAVSEQADSADAADRADEAASDSVAYQTVWKLEDDPEAVLDPEKVDALLRALSSYASGQITPAEGADPSACGFDAPLVTVQAATAKKTVTLTYASGTDGYYLMVEGDSSVYCVDQSTVQALLLTENALKTS